MPASPDAPGDVDPVLRVVDELEVEVGVVDGRVAPGLVAADVERVRVPLGDLEPRLPGRVEDGRGDLRDAAAHGLLVLVLDDHGGRPEAALGRAPADAVVERERRARCDDGAVHQPDGELQVRDPVRRARIERRVRRETPLDPHRGRLGRGALGLGGADGELGRARARGDRRCQERFRGRRHVDGKAVLRRDDADVVTDGFEARVDRSALDRLAQPGEPRLRARAGDRHARLPRDGEREQLRDPPARQPPAHAGVLEPDRRRERRPRLAGRRCEVGRTDLHRVDDDRERDHAAPLEPGERPDDRSLGGFPVERRPDWPGTTSIDRPRRTSFASTCLRSTSRAIPSSL